MPLTRVTITGADESATPDDLLALSQEFPFVEWGILVSASSQGASRFPSGPWIAALQRLATEHPLHLSLHLCGQWVRDLLVGNALTFSVAFAHAFQRIQLNFHGTKMACDPTRFPKALAWLGAHRQYIFQLDGAKGAQYLETYCIDYGNGVPLFDASGGTGVVPALWPQPFLLINETEYAYHGYAGGLGPENLAEQLPLIAAAAGDAHFWIDMESGVRSDDGRQCDLVKVQRCLDIAAPYVTGA